MSEGPGRSLVIDANILIRASLGVRARELIERYVREVAFFAPDIAFADVEEHLPRICADTGVSLEKAMKTYESVAELVQEMPAPMYSDQEREARARIEKVDPDDWQVIACALALNCPIWTEDRDFFGAGIPTWTSDRVELYLANEEKPQLEEVKDTGK